MGGGAPTPSLLVSLSSPPPLPALSHFPLRLLLALPLLTLPFPFSPSRPLWLPFPCPSSPLLCCCPFSPSSSVCCVCYRVVFVSLPLRGWSFSSASGAPSGFDNCQNPPSSLPGPLLASAPLPLFLPSSSLLSHSSSLVLPSLSSSLRERPGLPAPVCPLPPSLDPGPWAWAAHPHPCPPAGVRGWLPPSSVCRSVFGGRTRGPAKARVGGQAVRVACGGLGSGVVPAPWAPGGLGGFGLGAVGFPDLSPPTAPPFLPLVLL